MLKKNRFRLRVAFLAWGLILPACQYFRTAPPAPSVAEPAYFVPSAGATFNKSSLFREGTPPVPSFSLQFINEQVLPKNQHFQNIPIGGLSALAYDPKNKMFLALSDDKGNKGFPPRFYQLQLRQKKEQYFLKWVDQVILRDSKGQPFAPIDPEGMAIFSGSRFDSVFDNKPQNQHQQEASRMGILISSEGAQMPSLLAPPQIFMFNSKGQKLFSFPVLDTYWQPQKIGTWGVKENKAFEALSLDPEQKYIYFATESALHQDGSPQLLAKNRQVIRINRWDIKSKNIKTQQYIYSMDLRIEQNNMKGANGLTDFISLGNQQLLTLERAYLKKPGLAGYKKMSANLVRLFLTDCSQATDISQYKQLPPLVVENTAVIGKKKQSAMTRNSIFTTCGKTLIANLNQTGLRVVKWVLPSGRVPPTELAPRGPNLRSLSSLSKIKVDNIEGIALGPQISKGKYLLVLVSDNNFSQKQKTQFLFFLLKKPIGNMP